MAGQKCKEKKEINGVFDELLTAVNNFKYALEANNKMMMRKHARLIENILREALDN